MRTDKKLCKEFGGDCEKLINKYFYIKWINGNENSDGTWKPIEYRSHVCQPHEISQRHYNNGQLYFCAPAESMFLKSNYELASYNIFGVKFMPNYLNANTDQEKSAIDREVNNFVIGRE